MIGHESRSLRPSEAAEPQRRSTTAAGVTPRSAKSGRTFSRDLRSDSPAPNRSSTGPLAHSSENLYQRPSGAREENTGARSPTRSRVAGESGATACNPDPAKGGSAY